MKTVFLFALVLLFCNPNVQAQDVNISSIPYAMHFENKVQDYKVLGKTISGLLRQPIPICLSCRGLV